MNIKIKFVVPIVFLTLLGCEKQVAVNSNSMEKLEKLSVDEMKALIDSVQIEDEIRAIEKNDKALEKTN